MNEKLNIQDLIDLLAEKHGMSKKNADNFVKEFFLLIEESLEKDKYVKIKGLGTFKLIDVDSRESVNVNTGERFEIQGHTKVSFTPEPTLKDIINKPFSHFETVVLNDSTVLEDTPLDNESEDEEQEQDIPQELLNEPSENETSEVVIEEVVEEEEVAVVKEVTVVKEEEVVSVEEPVMEKEQEQEQQEEIEITSNQPNEESVVADASDTMIVEEENKTEETPLGFKETTDSSTMKYFIGIVVFVIVLCGGAVMFMYYPDLLDSFTSKPPVEKEEVAKADQTTLTDSLSAKEKEIVEPVKPDTVAESVAVATTPKEMPKESVTQPSSTKEQKKPATPFEPDSVGYTIAGTETTYTIKEGETLTKVALRFYGTKALWPYIVKHNPGVIKNPDNVPFGTTIKIPKLVKKQ